MTIVARGSRTSAIATGIGDDRGQLITPQESGPQAGPSQCSYGEQRQSDDRGAIELRAGTAEVLDVPAHDARGQHHGDRSPGKPQSGFELTRQSPIIPIRYDWTVNESLLVNTLGHSAGVLIFGIFLVLLLRDRAARRLRGGVKSMVAALLALVWNVASLIVLGSDSPDTLVHPNHDRDRVFGAQPAARGAVRPVSGSPPSSAGSSRIRAQWAGDRIARRRAIPE